MTTLYRQFFLMTESLCTHHRKLVKYKRKKTELPIILPIINNNCNHLIYSMGIILHIRNNAINQYLLNTYFELFS